MSKPTLFEDLRQEVDVEPGRSPFFYRKAFRRLSKRYAADPQRLIRDEMRDSMKYSSRDLTRDRAGHLLVEAGRFFSRLSSRFGWRLIWRRNCIFRGGLHAMLDGRLSQRSA